MLKYDRNDFIAKEKIHLDVIPKTEKIVDEVFKKGFSNIFFIGAGGTITSIWRAESNMKARTALEYHWEYAAEFTAIGNKRFSKDSLVFVSSVSGDTKEIVAAVAYAQNAGAKVVGFIEKEGAPLAKAVDYLIHNEGGDSYYWLAVAFRLMYLNGEFPEYYKLMAEVKKLPELLADVQEQADAKAYEYAGMYQDEPIIYIVGAGNLWSWAYWFAMCLLEEALWMRTKSIHAAEFFHGTMEVIERDIPVTIFMGEDDGRPLTERVYNFVPKISAKVSVFDSKDYELPGISPEFRGIMSPMVLSAVCGRISTHLEEKRKHPMQIRRYYRKLDY